MNSFQKTITLLILLIFLLQYSCKTKKFATSNPTADKIKPTLVTQKVRFDTDDPAIWYNSDNPEESLILGTDKAVGGGLYVFGLDGKIREDLGVKDLSFPNNVDIEYGLKMKNGSEIDIAVTGERSLGKVRIFSVPDMLPIDNGGIPVFETESNEEFKRPMGVALYKNPLTHVVSMILSRKTGPTDGTYLWQYQIVPQDDNTVRLKLLRKFGNFSGGEGEIEAIMVDDELGYVYYSDEAYGIRKYFADPSMGEDEIIVFGKGDFLEDREGIALWTLPGYKGYIIISDQQDLSFNVYPRNPEKHHHKLIKKIYLSSIETEGCDLISKPLNNQFPDGFFIAMSEGKTYHLYRLDHLGI